MIVFNDTGYGTKKATVQRAVMYNLAPKASVLLSIDSLWLSDFWAGMYVSAALRGAHVYGIAPSPANAPSSADLYDVSGASEHDAAHRGTRILRGGPGEG